MVFASTVVAPVSAQDRSTGHLRVVDAPSFSALPHDVIRDTRVSRDARLLYAVMQMYWWQGGECYASNAAMAADLGCSDSQLRRYIAELIRAGYITSRMRGQGQAKAYAPTKPLTSDGKAAREPLTDERLNRSEMDGSDSNRSPVTGQPLMDGRFNRSPVTVPYKKTKEDSLKEEDTESVCAADAAPPAPKKGKPERKKSQATVCPETFPLDEKHFAYAESLGIARDRALAETEKFLAYHRFKGTRGVDWYAGWQNWMRRSVQYDAPAQSKPAMGSAAPKKINGAKGWSVNT